MTSKLTSAMLLGPQSAGLSRAVVMGLDKKGQFHFATTVTDAKEALFLIECARTRVIAVIEALEKPAQEGEETAEVVFDPAA